MREQSACHESVFRRFAAEYERYITLPGSELGSTLICSPCSTFR